MSPDGYDFDNNPFPEVLNPPTTEQNVPARARKLAYLFRERSQGHRHNNVLVLMGGDYHFQVAERQFRNMKPLLEYINLHSAEFNMSVQFARVSQYFRALEKQPPAKGFPTME